MHNGVFKSLKEVVHFYNTRDVIADWPPPEVEDNVNDAELGDLGLTDEEEDAIVAFMRTLSDGYVPRKAAPPVQPLVNANYAGKGASGFRLYQNTPNPFNPETWIPYQLAEDVDVTIEIYGVSGQLIRALDLGYRPAGLNTDRVKAAYWDGTNEAGEQVSSGIYFYTIKAGGFTAMKKMLVVR